MVIAMVDSLWFTTVISDRDENIVKSGITKAVKRYNKSDLVSGLIDYDFWKRYSGLSEEKCKKINRKLIELVLSGEYLDKERVIKELMKVAGISRYKAELIAITELSNLSNLVRLIAYNRRTKVVKFKWVTEDDDKVCDKCREMYERTKNGVTRDELLRLIKEIGGDSARGYILHPRCYTAEHYLWTVDGWKKWDDVKVGDEVWSVNPDTLELEKAKVKRVIKYWYDGNVIHFHNKWFSLEVTEDHSLWVARLDDERLREVKAKDVKKSCRMLRIAKWKGKKVEKVSKCGIEMDASDYVEFMGWYLSEGCVVERSVYKASKNKDSLARYEIRIAQEKNRNRNRIYELCKRIFSRYGIRVWKCKSCVIVCGKNADDFAEWLMSFGKSKDRGLPDDLKEMDKKHIRKFLFTYVYGDGHIGRKSEWKNGRWRRVVEIFTSSERMMNDLCEIIMKAGYQFSVRKNSVYRIRIKRSRWSYLYNLSMDVKKYKGYVYDVELDKNHVLLVMKDGKVVWSGNCRCAVVRANEDKRYMRWWE